MPAWTAAGGHFWISSRSQGTTEQSHGVAYAAASGAIAYTAGVDVRGHGASTRRGLLIIGTTSARGSALFWPPPGL